MKYKKCIIFVTFLIFVLLSLGIYLFIDYQIDQNKFYKKTVVLFSSLYIDKDERVPSSDIDIKKVDSVLNEVKKIVYDDERKKMISELRELKTFISVRDDVLSCFDGEVLKSDVSIERIEEVTLKYKRLSIRFQKLLKSKVDSMIPQFNNIQEVTQVVVSLFTDNSMVTVKEDITRENYNNAFNKVNLLLQKDISIKQQEYLKIVDNELAKREEIERRRLEEIERQKRQREIAAAWHVLDVPYISQNLNNVFNGCEVASLLMGLQYKGYLRDMSLQSYAEAVPKSSDPFSGFTYSIFELEPLTVPHWIAPGALALYGRNSSGNLNVTDATGSSLKELDEQIIAGNPVVIYLTSKFRDPKSFIEGAPKNIHVLLLTGYNSITGEHIITDPWTHDDGTIRWHISKEKVEKIYNATGKRSVVIK